MAQPEARAWWADVEHLRDGIEQRRVSAAAPDAPAHDPGSAPRRTVQITGRGAAAPAPRPLMVTRERPPRALDAATRRPDRIAGWAALLGLVLVLVSTATH
jgi:hypothetical protein